MTVTIVAHQDNGPFYGQSHPSVEVESFKDFSFNVRSFFEDHVDSILVLHDGKVTGLWLAEPEIDCDSDGYFEVDAGYAGAEYNLYRPTHRSFWNYVGYHYGLKYIPAGRGFDAERHSKVHLLPLND